MTADQDRFANLGPNGRAAVLGLEINDRLVRQAKEPGFRKDAWDELAVLYAVDVFRRIAANRESRNWDEDVSLRHQFAQIAGFEHDIRRVAEVGNTVYVDVIETIIMKDQTFAINTLGILEFDEDGLITKSTTYQQWDPDRVPTHVGRMDEAAG